MAGIGLGLAIAARSRAAIAPLILMAAFAGLAMAADAAGWSAGIRAGIDSAFLLAAAVLAALLWRDLAPRGESAGDRP